MQQTLAQTQQPPKVKVNLDLFNLASFVASELRASSPYRTGNMQRSISVVQVMQENGTIEIVIATDYASYVNEQEKHFHWIQRVLDRACRAYASNNVDARALMANVSYRVLTGAGGKGE